ncbi:DUF2273 domain-containing protein [Aeromicrobium sp. Root495]|uniref:DUF2273 domain-containing protein n=1 Tax=Aeromicrobium sp. Root495 TaxID=1736550 RepID=UPI0009EA5A8A|nr:DUF2273 domain-containing protein [Aeromicrobium sp. Root495]RYJ01912.1 MAG: DUF2273 domain-containing protein [Actinomycetales bacterium]
MNLPVIGLLTGLLLAIAIAIGGFGAFLGAVVLGGAGLAIGAHLSGDIDVTAVLRGRRE